jgi:sulfide:quinone oxidoreductase
MNARKLTDDLTAAAQIDVTEVVEIKAAGFKSIICNRPDGESSGQTPHTDIAAAAKAAGLEFRYQPVVSGQMTATDAADFGALLKSLPGPVFAYCRSGTRCTLLWDAASKALNRDFI